MSLPNECPPLGGHFFYYKIENAITLIINFLINYCYSNYSSL